MAASQNAHIVTLTSEDEQVFINSNVIMKLPQENHVWIGFTDEQTEGTWKWVTGESVSYLNWCYDEPSQSSNDYAFIDPPLSSSKCWSSATATESGVTYAIIEKDPPSGVMGTWVGTMKIARPDGTYTTKTGITIQILKQAGNVISGTMGFSGRSIAFSGLQKGATLSITAVGLWGTWTLNADYSIMTSIRMHETRNGNTMSGSVTRQ